jgi:hypothetical protein
MYGSNFCAVTLKPRSFSNLPMAAAVTPFPTELTTPPVKKMYLVVIIASKVLLLPTAGNNTSFHLPG